jgi:hypothetical protein
MGDLGGLITCEKKFTRKGPVLDYSHPMPSATMTQYLLALGLAH